MQISDSTKIQPISNNQQDILISNDLSDLYIKEVTDLIASGKMFEKPVEIVPKGKPDTRIYWSGDDLVLIESARRIWYKISAEFSEIQKRQLKSEMGNLKNNVIPEKFISVIFFKSLIKYGQLHRAYMDKSTSKYEISKESVWGNIIELYNSGHTFHKHHGKSLVIEKDPILYKYFSELAQKKGVVPKKPKSIYEVRSQVDQISNKIRIEKPVSTEKPAIIKEKPVITKKPAIRKEDKQENYLIIENPNKKRIERPVSTEEPFIKKDKQEKLDDNRVIDLIKFYLEDVKNDIIKINWKWIAHDKDEDIPAIKMIWESYLRDLESKVTDENSMSQLRKLISMCDKEKPVDWEGISKTPSNNQKTAEDLNLEWQQSVVNSSVEFFNIDLFDLDYDIL